MSLDDIERDDWTWMIGYTSGGAIAALCVAIGKTPSYSFGAVLVGSLLYFLLAFFFNTNND